MAVARPSQPKPSPSPLASAGRKLREAVLAQIPGIVWATDAELRCQFASTAATRLGLRDGEDITGVLPSDAAEVLLTAHRTALAGTTARCEVTIAGVSLRCLLAPLRDVDGAVIGVLGSAEDNSDRDEAARILETQRAVFAAAIDHTPEGIVICDAAGRFLYTNAAARRVAELETEGSAIADGGSVWGAWHDESGRLVGVEEWPVSRALRGEMVSAVDCYKDLRDGRRFYMQVSAAPIRDAAGAIIGAAGTAIDVTARKQAEQQIRDLNQDLERRVRARTAELEDAVREREREGHERQRMLELLERSERLLSDVVNHSTAVIYLKDLDGRYLMINQHYERLFGVTNERFKGRTDYDLFPTDVADAVRANDRQVLDMDAPLHVEEVVPNPDGRSRAYISVKFPLRDRQGTVYGVCGMSTDITELKEMEAKLRSSDATLVAIIESSSDPICALSRDWQLMAMNAATANFIPALIGSLPDLRSPLGSIPEDFAAQWRDLLERGMHGERVTVERTLPIAGTPRQFLVSFNPTVQDGVATGVAVFGREVTEIKRAEEEARQHQAELAHVLRLHTMGEMAASLAHEVNQPLGAIANYAQGCRNRLKAGKTDHAELLQTVEAIAREALRAGEITRRVRELLRKEEAPRAWVDAVELVRAALDIVAATARRHDVALVARCDTGPLMVLADQIQIEQVVINLMLNAVEATRGARDPRLVEVRAAPAAGGGVEVAVSDTGPGIDPALAERIFEPFLTTKSGGLGMGLAISRSIVEAHGGRIAVESAAGGGTTIIVTVPGR